MKKLFVIIPVFVLIIGLGGFYFLNAKTPTKQNVEEEVPTPSVLLPTVSGDVKVNLKARVGKRAVDLEISGFPPDIQTIEYELIYLTSSGLSRGVNGKRKVQDLPISDITLGSCSTGGKCTYDEGVSSLDLVLKFNAENGSSIFRKTFPI